MSMRRAAAVLVVGTLAGATAEAAPCSDADALAIANKLRVRWKSTAKPRPDDAPSSKPDPSGVGGIRLDGPNNAYIELSCVGGTFGKTPAYYIDAIDNRHQGDNRIRKRYRQLVTRDGVVIAAMPTVDDLERQLDHAWSYKALDVDGDGIDEILATDAFEHNGLAASRSTHVLAIRGAKVEDTGFVTIETSGTMWPTCTGKLLEEKAGKATRLVLVADKPQTPGTDCPTAGRHPYALVAGKLVEVDGAGKPVKKP